MNSLILNIETSTTVCSVALADKGQVIAAKEINEGYSHAENLHLFINEILATAKIDVKDLKAIAVGSGPGSYTGLRIGVSAAKGFAYALQIPLLAVNTLKIMASSTIGIAEDQLYCSMLDARRMEVYCSVFDNQLNEIKATSAEIISEENLNYFTFSKPICFFGDGMPKCKEILSQLPNASFIEGVEPSARQLAQLSYQKFLASQFEDIAYFEPLYLKDFLIKTKESH